MAGVTIDAELFHIFTYYSLHGDPLDPEHIRASQLIRLARDCQMVGPGLLLEADVAVAFQAEVTRVEKVAPGTQKLHSAMKMAPIRAPTATTTDRKKVRAGTPPPPLCRRPAAAPRERAAPPPTRTPPPSFF